MSSSCPRIGRYVSTSSPECHLLFHSAACDRAVERRDVMTACLLSIATILGAPLPESGKTDTVTYVFEARVKDNNGFRAFPLAPQITGEFTADIAALKGATGGKSLRSPRNSIVFRTPLGVFRSTA